MLVQRSDLPAVVQKLSKTGRYALDTETTGLRPYQGHRLFSIVIYDGENPYYFDFQETLPRSDAKALAPILANPDTLWFLHNAKFDMAMLWNEGLTLAGTIHCTMAIGRVERNDRFNYDLDALAQLIGEKKSGAVEAYISENDLYEAIVDEEGETVKVPRYDRVPLNLMREYAEQDARITWRLGESQIRAIGDLRDQALNPVKSPWTIMEQERAVTKVFFEMEKVGVQVDLAYCEKARKFERDRMHAAARKFIALAGVPFVDSAKTLAPVFDALGLIYPRTAKGNPSFKKEALEGLKHPIVDTILQYRDAHKRFGTYLANYFTFADSNQVIHCQMNQHGAKHGRISISNPSLQNVNKRKDKESPYPIRRAFVPRAGFFFVMIDFDQMEYRLMVEYAMEQGLIDAILSGLDVHEATACMMGVERESAKTINFMLLYGGGIAELAIALFNTTLPHAILKALGRRFIYGSKNYDARLLDGLAPDIVEHNLTELRKAHALLQQYFSRLPSVEQFVENVSRAAKQRGYVLNWMGRRIYCRDKSHAYAIPNHLISGGCADIVKKAMLEIAEFLRPYKSRMILQIHDEILFEIADDEAHLVEPLRIMMERAYPHRHIPMTCGVDWSRTSWHDKVEWHGSAT